LRIPDIPYREEVEMFVRKVASSLKVHSIILYGSMARGDYGAGSDVDIIVISDNLPRNFDRRLRMLAELNNTTAPIECLAYTPREFEIMLSRMHPTVLYALDEGIIIYDDGTTEEMKRKFNKLKQLGIVRKFRYGWKFQPSKS